MINRFCFKITDDLIIYGNKSDFKWMMAMVILAVASAKVDAQSYDLDAVVNWDGYVTVDNIKYTLSSDGRAILIDGKKTSGHVVIPNTVYKNKRPYVVTEIGPCAFCENKNIISVELPNTATIIDDNVFRECDNLVSVKMPEKVKEFGAHVFVYCYSLKDVTIPDGVKRTRDAFNYCKSLESIVIPKSVEFISMFTFNWCTSLKKVIIKNSNIRIAEDVFDMCKNVEIIYVDENGSPEEQSLP